MNKLVSQLNILLVDDDELILEITRDLLQKLGYCVRAETDPRNALIQMSESQYDVVITDLNMPMMSGFELAALIRKIDAAIAIYIISANDIPLQELDKYSINGAFLKPIDSREIKKTLEQLVK